MLGQVLCPECAGTGKYIGLSESGACKTCGGSGKTGAAMTAIDQSSMVSSFELLMRRCRYNRYLRAIAPTIHKKQKLFLEIKDLEVLYGGSSGGGKSQALLIAALQYVDVPCYSAILFRRTFTDLSGEDAIMDRATKWLVPWMNAKECRWSAHDKSFFFTTVKWEAIHIAERRAELARSDVNVAGMSDSDIHDLLGPANPSRLAFGYLESEADKYRYQGWQFHFCCECSTLVRMADWSLRPIGEIRVGDQVATLEGPRKVTKVWQPWDEDCIRAEVFNAYGQRAGTQIHANYHRVLTPTGWNSLGWVRNEEVGLAAPKLMRCGKWSIRHPYNDDRPLRAVGVYPGKVSCYPAGKQRVCDIRVADVSHYITESGLISANCGTDELTQHPEGNYTYLFSRVRRAGGAAIPLRVRSASNPGGIFGIWVKERFIPDDYLAADVDTQFSRIWYKSEPCTECHEGLIYEDGKAEGEVCYYCDGKRFQHRVFVPARAEDNPSLDIRSYKKSLAKLMPIERARLERGRWDITEEGGHFQQSMFRHYSKVGDHFVIHPEEGQPPLIIGKEHLTFFLTADTASKLKQSADYTAIQAWAYDSRNFNLLLMDMIRERIAIPDMPRIIMDQSRKWGCSFVMIEEASSGIGLLAELRTARGEGISLVPYSPHTGDKLARAHAAIRRMSDGRVYFPSTNPSWMSIFVAELLAFPIGEHDDTVDALVQACHYVDTLHHRENGNAGGAVQATPGMGAHAPIGVVNPMLHSGAIGGLRRGGFG